MERSNFCMEGSNSCMEHSEFDWGEMTGGEMTMGRNHRTSELQLIKSANAILRHPSHNMQTV